MGRLKNVFNQLKIKVMVMIFLIRGALHYGKPLRIGWIVRFRFPEVDFDEALQAGPEHMMEYFSDAIGGLYMEHVEELRKLGLFSAILRKTELDVDVGSWKEIPAEKLGHLIEIIEEIQKQPTSLGNLLEDMLDMAKKAQTEGCSIGFMLAD